MKTASSFLFDILSFSTAHSPSPSGSAAGATPQAPSVYVLPKPPARFYGRAHELELIGGRLKTHNSVTLRGIGGVGKTSIALRFAHKSLSDFSIIVWLRSEPTTAMDQGCLDALHQLKLVERADKPGAETRQKWRDYLLQACSSTVS